ncbi:hypothetical protein [Lysinibacillus xylanilyticus]|uniref:hypothetical protein n=1 Tax=Lysinibacillus xylanilyticus TaxID=582475 RepID=UPI0036DDA478
MQQHISPESFHFAIARMDAMNYAIPDLYDGMDIEYNKGQDASTFCEVVMPVFIEILLCLQRCM